MKTSESEATTPFSAVCSALGRGESARRKQAGVSLFIVLVLVLIATSIALASGRIASNSNALISNEADYLRTREAAEAALRDAELDIQGIQPNGQPCTASQGGCRTLPTLNFPQSLEEQQDSETALLAANRTCLKGVCTNLNQQQFWASTDWKDTFPPNETGARFGEFTGASPGSNPVLLAGQAWYWVEVLRYNEGRATATGSPSKSLAPGNVKRPFVYRITAVAEGVRNGTKAVIQSVFIADPKRN